MRKFLEALGLPADEAPPPAKRAASVAPPPLPQPREKQKRKPRPVFTDRSLDEAPAPSLRVEELHLPELETRGVAEFHTRSSEVSAIPTEPPVTAFADPYAGAQQQIPADIFRRLLAQPPATPAILRAKSCPRGAKLTRGFTFALFRRRGGIGRRADSKSGIARVWVRSSAGTPFNRRKADRWFGRFAGKSTALISADS